MQARLYLARMYAKHRYPVTLVLQLRKLVQLNLQSPSKLRYPGLGAVVRRRPR